MKDSSAKVQGNNVQRNGSLVKTQEGNSKIVIPGDVRNEEPTDENPTAGTSSGSPTIGQSIEVDPGGAIVPAPLGRNTLEPDLLGVILVLVAFLTACLSFFFIYQSLNLQKALFPTRKHKFINSDVAFMLPIIVFLFVLSAWLFYIWVANISGIQFYRGQGFFYLNHPRLFLLGLLIANLFPTSIALYYSYLLHHRSQSGKSSSTKEVAKRASIFSSVFNLINLVASIITLVIFASSVK
jgi:hypothetical protein